MFSLKSKLTEVPDNTKVRTLQEYVDSLRDGTHTSFIDDQAICNTKPITLNEYVRKLENDKHPVITLDQYIEKKDD